MTDDTNKLERIYNSISDHLVSGKDMLVSTQRLLVQILDIIGTEDMSIEQELLSEEQIEETIIISCDASIKKNPGGPASVGVVLRFPNEKQVTKVARIVPASTNNEAEYDAIYEGLNFIANLHNKIQYPICVRSDSQLVVKQLLGEYKIENESLKKRCKSIHSLAASLNVPVKIEWHPRNSTPDLSEANYLAQDAIGVPRH